MEKILASVVTIALTFTVGFAHDAESAFTQPVSSQSVTYSSTCTDYVDADYDGFCDNCNSHHSALGSVCSGYVDTDNDGFCDNCNSHHSALSGVCSGYVDADNDGFCDNHTYGEHCPYSPATTPNDSVNTPSENYSSGHHRNSNHHGHGHH